MTARRPFRGSSSRLVVLAALAVLAGLLPGTASADPQRGLLVIEGQGNRSAVVEITEATRPGTPVPTLTGGDRYAAVLFEQLGSDQRVPIRVFVAQVRAFRDDTGAAQGAGANGPLGPGRYRVTLLGDAPLRAEWELTDPEAPGMVVVPRTPVAARFLGRTEPIAEGMSSARVDLGNALPAGRRALQVMLLQGTRVDETRMCATVGSDCPDEGLPICLPAPASCSPVGLPTSTSTGDPTLDLRFVEPSNDRRSLLWAVEGYREEPDRLRAAAIVF